MLRKRKRGMRSWEYDGEEGKEKEKVIKNEEQKKIETRQHSTHFLQKMR